jgi:hypothetical protein
MEMEGMWVVSYGMLATHFFFKECIARVSLRRSYVAYTSDITSWRVVISNRVEHEQKVSLDGETHSVLTKETNYATEKLASTLRRHWHWRRDLPLRALAYGKSSRMAARLEEDSGSVNVS